MKSEQKPQAILDARRVQRFLSGPVLKVAADLDRVTYLSELVELEAPLVGFTPFGASYPVDGSEPETQDGSGTTVRPRTVSNAGPKGVPPTPNTPPTPNQTQRKSASPFPNHPTGEPTIGPRNHRGEMVQPSPIGEPRAEQVARDETHDANPVKMAHREDPVRSMELVDALSRALLHEEPTIPKITPAPFGQTHGTSVMRPPDPSGRPEPETTPREKAHRRGTPYGQAAEPRTHTGPRAGSGSPAETRAPASSAPSRPLQRQNPSEPASGPGPLKGQPTLESLTRTLYSQKDPQPVEDPSRPAQPSPKSSLGQEPAPHAWSQPASQPHTGEKAGTRPGPGSGSRRHPGQGKPHPANHPGDDRDLADLVNEALVEQARLHGVDLS